MQILVVTQDHIVLDLLNDKSIQATGNFTIFNQTKDPLEIISVVHSQSPSMLILDDDMLKPNSSKILKSIKQITQNKVVIFLTSDNSLELGREISPLGVYYYGIKPISKEIILDLINSVKSKNKSITIS
ncbi:MAG: response regulator [Bacteroidota bacterium]